MCQEDIAHSFGTDSGREYRLASIQEGVAAGVIACRQMELDGGSGIRECCQQVSDIAVVALLESIRCRCSHDTGQDCYGREGSNIENRGKITHDCEEK